MSEKERLEQEYADVVDVLDAFARFMSKPDKPADALMELMEKGRKALAAREDLDRLFESLIAAENPHEQEWRQTA
jgi:Zn-dependent M32 family carboxypeptidase